MDFVTERLSRVQAAEAVVSRWNELEIPYVIAHGVEDYPRAVGRDLDIHMDPGHAHQALREARQTLETGGWPKAVCPPPLWGDRIVALAARSDDRYDYLEFHTAPGFTWLFLPLVTTHVSVTSWIGPFPINAWTTFAKSVMLPLLGGETSKFSSRHLESSWRQVTEKDDIEVPLANLIGRPLAADLLAASQDGNAQELLSMRSEVRRSCLRHMAAHPASSFGRVWPVIKKRLDRMSSDAGARVRISVPAGIVAQDIASDLATRLDHVFVVTKLDSPRRWLGRLGQQYHVLSRQGLVIEVGYPSSGDEITLTAELGPRRLQESHSFPSQADSDQMSAWILMRWADSQRCD